MQKSGHGCLKGHWVCSDKIRCKDFHAVNWVHN